MALRAAKITTLSNGFKVATSARKGTVGVQLLVGAGSRHDAVLGSAALFGTSLGRNKEIEVANMGGSYSSVSDRETTAYSLCVPPSSAKGAIAWLGDQVVSPTLTDKAMTDAKAAHLAKITEDVGLIAGPRGGASEAVLTDRLMVSCFRDSTLGNPVLGTKDDVATITASTMKEFLAANYTSNRMVLAVTGPVEHDEVVKAAEAAFGKLQPKDLPIVPAQPYFLSAEMTFRNDEMGPNAYLSCGYEAAPIKSSDTICFDLMAQLMGTYDSDAVTIVPAQISGNRLTYEVANKMQVGCAKYYTFFNKQFTDTGLFGWFAVADELAVEHCVGEMIFGVNGLSSYVTEEEISRAKRELKVKMVTSNMSNAGAAEQIAADVLNYGRHVTPCEYNLRVDAIDGEDLKRVAYKYLHDAEISMACLGPLHGLPDHYHIRRNTAMWRY
jgi:processing peptidase subunit beta